MKKIRFFYAIIALALFVVEVCIALYASGWVRGYLGDALVVIFIHCSLRIFWPQRCRLLPCYVFLFACLAEFLQYMHLLERLGLSHHAWLRLLAGGTFSWGDVVCYFLGCVAVGGLEYAMDQRNR